LLPHSFFWLTHCIITHCVKCVKESDPGER
jgi:hypothetical protein